MYSVVLATVLTAGAATPDWQHGCYGCYCSCSGCYGCCGGCWGCHGCWGCGGCWGCYGCGGGCWGCHGCWGCYGCYGCCGGCYGGYCSCYGCGGCYGCCGGVVYAPPAPKPPPPPPEDKGKSGERRQKEEVKVDRARVIVRLPSDARLTVDGVDCPLASGNRTFDTPALEPGKKYVYTMKAEVVRDGQTYAETRRVIVEAGKRVKVDFSELPELQAAQR